MALVPVASALGAPYFEGANRGELLIQRCECCSAVWHPPLPICPRCTSSDVSWVPASGRGTVFSYTIVHLAAHPDFAGRVPYVAALVELEEGPRMVADILDVDPRDVSVGMPVEVRFVQVAEGVTLPQFTPTT